MYALSYITVFLKIRNITKNIRSAALNMLDKYSILENPVPFIN